jgi:predicted DNA-binding transcriptional regulator YafY
VPPTIKELEPKSVDQLEKEIPRFSNMSDAFNWGLENQQVVKISYQTTRKRRKNQLLGNNLITRYIEPHGRFVSHPENEPSHQILVTYDETAGGIRAFRLANIRVFFCR